MGTPSTKILCKLKQKSGAKLLKHLGFPECYVYKKSNGNSQILQKKTYYKGPAALKTQTNLGKQIHSQWTTLKIPVHILNLSVRYCDCLVT